MSTRVNSAAIGAFVVGAIVLLLVALLVWGGTGLFRSKLTYVLFFDSAVTGLNKGAPVLARGVKIGEVTDVQLRWGTRGVIGVYVGLEPDLVKGMAAGGPAQALERAVQQDGLRAQLRLESFVTGVLYVAFDLRPDTPIVLRGLDPKVPEMPTIPTDIEVWTAKLERFAEKIEKIPLDHIGQSAAAVLDGVRNMVDSKEAQDLLRNADAAIGDARTLVRHVDAQIDPLIGQIRQTLARLDGGLDAARKLVTDVDGRVDPLVTQAEATLKSAQTALDDARPLIEDLRRIAGKLDAQADPLLTSLRGTSDAARVTLERAQVTLGSVDQTLEQDSPLGLELFQMLRELRAAAVALRSLADYLERVPDAPVYGIRRPSGASR
jgi:phospholipid/cholesterol/gamma-HCH transport system substrate-binding protein